MNETVVAALIFLIALLYSTGGLAGGSGYLAALALAGVDAGVIKPTALVLNVLVATIATARLGRGAGRPPARFWPLAASAIPASYLGGSLILPGDLYRPLAGVLLLIAAGYMLRRAGRFPDVPEPVRVPTGAALAAGAAIGLISGLVGTGGGIFLIPLLVATGWADPRRAAGITAVFILATSAAALAGYLTTLRALPAALALWAPAAALGGVLGAEIGRRTAGSPGLRRWLAVLLIVAAARLLLPETS